MEWWKAWHLVAVVSWFAGLFYLPRLFVYHAMTDDTAVRAQFMVMERRLYYAITWPAAILTTLTGSWMLNQNKTYYLAQPWMQGKLLLMGLLWTFHLICGHFVRRFKQSTVSQSHVFFRYFNELPTCVLIGTMILIFVRPQLWSV